MSLLCRRGGDILTYEGKARDLSVATNFTARGKCKRAASNTRRLLYPRRAVAILQFISVSVPAAQTPAVIIPSREGIRGRTY